MITVAELFEKSTESLQLFTDGEKRYSQLLFDICNEVLRTGKRGRPLKVLPKGLVLRLKNKSSKRRDSEGKLKKRENYNFRDIVSCHFLTFICNSEDSQ